MCRWFYFRVSGVEGQNLRMRITNAGEASYPRAWQGYNACASYDRKYWFRIATRYDSKSGVLEIVHKPTRVCHAHLMGKEHPVMLSLCCMWLAGLRTQSALWLLCRLLGRQHATQNLSAPMHKTHIGLTNTPDADWHVHFCLHPV